MRENVLRVVAAALVTVLSAPASAHEFECEKKAGLLKVGEDGLLLQDGLPVFLATPAPVLRIQRYPATIGFEITLRNKAMAPSVVRVVGDPLLDALGDAAAWFGTAIVPDLSVPVGGAVTTIAAVFVRSQAECLALLEGGTFDAPICRDVIENRFFVEHDVGAAECRARIVCAPPSDDPCEAAWNGPKLLLDASVHFPYDIAIDSRCQVSVTGYMDGPDPQTRPLIPFLARLDSRGALDQWLQFWMDGDRAGSGRSVVVDDAGNRFVAWDATVIGSPVVVASRFEPDGTETWRRIVRAGATEPTMLLDPAGNPCVGATAPAWTPYVAKLDAATGTLLWEREHSLGLSPIFPEFAMDGGGNVVLAGDVVGAAPGSDVFAAMLDAAGVLLWVNQFGTAPVHLTVRALAADAAGNAYLAGEWNPPFGTGPFEAFLTKIDPAGNVLWTRQLGAADASSGTRALAVAVTPDGNAWIAGQTNAALAGETWAGATDAFAARYDGAGNLLWVNQFGGVDRDMAVDVALDRLGNGYVVYDTELIWHIVKLDPNGNVQ